MCSIKSTIVDKDGKRAVGGNCDPVQGYTEDAEAAGDYTRMYVLSDVNKKDDNVQVAWTYDVRWVPSAVQWASRWDIYLSMGNRFSDDIHWFAIVNSVIIAVFLTVGDGRFRRCTTATRHTDVAMMGFLIGASRCRVRLCGCLLRFAGLGGDDLGASSVPRLQPLQPGRTWVFCLV